MFGFQAEGSAPIVRKHRVNNPQTVATAIRIGNPASWEYANKALEESNGYINMLSDEEILKAYILIARNDGIFCEPASAISVAGLLKYHKNFKIKKEQNIVCVLTGHGLKDTDNALAQSSKIKDALEPDLDLILERVLN
jgi:threonine synthase